MAWRRLGPQRVCGDCGVARGLLNVVADVGSAMNWSSTTSMIGEASDADGVVRSHPGSHERRSLIEEASVQTGGSMDAAKRAVKEVVD